MSKAPKDLVYEEFEDPKNLLMDNSKAGAQRKKLASEFAEQLTIGTPTQQDEEVLKKLLSQLKSGKIVVRLYLKHQLHAKLYLTHTSSGITPKLGLLGSSNFTFAGLCTQGELNIDVVEEDAASKLDKWFNDRWNDRWCIDITEELIKVLEQSWARLDKIIPYKIYLKMAYCLSQEARAGLVEFKLPEEFRKDLLDFQQAAVKIAAHHLHKRNGVMIGDVVGLGKTIIAAAIAKLMEDDLQYNTLILCPKNLVSMWEGYREEYGLHAKVLSHSMILSELSATKRYRLIIIDESHNFRNSEGQMYKALRTYIEENESKVILLSATPYNKSYEDLASQLKLFLPEDLDLGISPEKYISSLGGAVHFHAKHTDTHIRTIKAFEKSSYSDDWRDIMKLFLIRRTRSFIRTNYAHEDERTGRKYLMFPNGEYSYFPERRPKKVSFELNSDKPDDQYAQLYDDETVTLIDDLNLPRYGLQYYRTSVPIKLTPEEERIFDNLSRAGKKVKGFCRTNLYKRLESSGYSFLISVSRHIIRNNVFSYAVKNGLPLPVAGQSVDVNFYEDADGEDDLILDLNFEHAADSYEKLGVQYYNVFETQLKKRFKWINSEIFDKELLLRHLAEDNEALLKILSCIKIWNSDHDRKLVALYNLLTKQHKIDKVLVFTQFADTAECIFKYLKGRGLEDIEVAVGGSDNIANIVDRFSPCSNKHPEITNKREELRVLIATDVLSEGQNLQDSHIVVNFDLPWALVRLIQRAGRVDRLGQKSEEIVCYSFLPEDGVEKIINLRHKLKNRISQNAEVVGSDEIFFDGDPVNVADLYSEKSGIFDEHDDAEVDLVSYAYQIWKNAIDARPELEREIKALPDVAYSAKENNTVQPGSGVIVYTRTSDNNDILTWLDDQGKVITQSQYAILRAAECNYNTPAVEKLLNHHELVKKGVDSIMREDANTSGTLGRKHGIKYRTYTILEKHEIENAARGHDTTRLKRAMDDIYRYSLKGYAIDAISRQLKTGISDDDLANLVIILKEGDKLCIVTDEKESRTAKIICSISILKGGI